MKSYHKSLSPSSYPLRTFYITTPHKILLYWEVLLKHAVSPSEKYEPLERLSNEPKIRTPGEYVIPTVNAGQVHFFLLLFLLQLWWNCLWCNWFSTTKLIEIKKKKKWVDGTLLCCQSCYKRIWSFWKAICWVKWWQICLCFDLFMLLIRIYHRGLPDGPVVENLPTNGGTRVRFWPRN